jgi:AcrR family transcriptional regulator
MSFSTRSPRRPRQGASLDAEPSAPAPTLRTRRADVTRSQLIDATIGVIRDRAFHGASVFEVAKMAGVTPGALQHHFGTKAELMMQVIDTILRGDDSTPGVAWPEPTQPLARRAEAVIRGLWDRVYAPDRFLVAWQVYFGCCHEEPLRQRIAPRRLELDAWLQGQFHASFPELRQRHDACERLDALLAALRGLGLLRLFDDTPPRLDGALQALIDQWVETCSTTAGTTPWTEPSANPAIPPPHRTGGETP